MQAEISSVIICDDVRKEVSGKDILIGVFSGGISVPAYPAVLRTALWIEIEPQHVGVINCELKIETPSGNPPFEMGFDLEVIEVGTAVFVMNGIPLALEKDGHVVVTAKLGDGDWREVKRKPVVRQIPQTI